MEHSAKMIGGCDRCTYDLEGPILLVCDPCWSAMVERPEEPSEIPSEHQPLPKRSIWWMPGVDTTSEGRFDRYEREVRA